MRFIHISTIAKASGLLTVCMLVAIVSGCFQSTNKFYRESDIARDKRLEGRFQVVNAQTNSPDYQLLVIKPGEHGHYSATFSERRKWISLDAVLFRCGTNLFVDISRIADNGLNAEPGVGPSGLDMLHIATQYDTHSVIRVRFSDKGFEIGGNYGNDVHRALEKSPGLKYRKGTTTQPIDPHQKILTNPTEELSKLLQTAGNDDTVFGFNGKFERTGEQ